LIVHATPSPKNGPTILSVQGTEALLEDWFGAPVVLASSGRGAILLMLREWALNRYASRVAVSRFISACVIDAVVRGAFPVDVATAGGSDAALLYHQYGFTQKRGVQGRVLEDICHAFFSTADTGKRNWMGDAAVFSLPKFFPTSSMVGGIITRDQKLAKGLRARRDAHQGEHLVNSREMGEIFRSRYHSGGGALEEIYTARLIDPRVLDTELGGLPSTLKAIRDVGSKRRSVMLELLAATNGQGLPPDWIDLLSQSLPFLFPVCGTEETLARAKQALLEIGVAVDLYQIDLARDMMAPRYLPMLLIPCHHEIPDRILQDILMILGSHAGR
jgi:hypothetical protein